MSTPTIGQMKARMLSGHRQVLVAARTSQRLDIRSDGELRGYRKVITTLRIWGAITEVGAITEIGLKLLEK